ncbi:tRNA pseudouridine(55) synthase TruB [Zooshikella harenae]|uniref:tRNA pseudouridine synthase B n=1 Tax=Zooshikella harenae TaxID=2827238 RepID=A0ABS5ZBA2_9GAMM|nr:tRNA pseudouridine(55) synthase TruB [Zooshikella harenae]MBU2710581.1 tRNA pseudouridine(55) synthase TruB [Zooshikella harenae]
MARRRRQRGRPVHGILVLDKRQGVTSNKVLQEIKSLFGAAKAGHTGSLDPLATGVLPICFGEATKFSQYLLDADKGYQAGVRFGIRTATGDAEGEIIEQRPIIFSEQELLTTLEQFTGEISQVPSMYSAIKVDGQPLYKLAREGIEVERKARNVVIRELSLTSFSQETAEIQVACSKGTYIRTLVEDIGEALGCGAYVTSLRRTSAGPFTLDHAYSIGQLDEACQQGGHEALDELLQPIDMALKLLPQVILGETTAYYLVQGQPVLVPRAPTAGFVRLYQEGDQPVFLGIGEILDDGRVAPRRLVRIYS